MYVYNQLYMKINLGFALGPNLFVSCDFPSMKQEFSCTALTDLVSVMRITSVYSKVRTGVLISP
jgi:hypothetical protein